MKEQIPTGKRTRWVSGYQSAAITTGVGIRLSSCRFSRSVFISGWMRWVIL